MKQILILPGQVFGRLTAIEKCGQNARRAYLWKFLCACGQFVVKVGSDAACGKVRSCGCLVLDVRTKHGWAVRGTTLAPEARKTYVAWNNIKTRCYCVNHSNFKHYGGRGIRVCNGWLDSFEAFRDDMGLPPSLLHTIERINNNGNYSCGKCSECKRYGWVANCLWATRREQQENKRTNRRLTIKGETLCVAEWARRIGIDRSSLLRRIYRGIIGDNLLKPSRNSR